MRDLFFVNFSVFMGLPASIQVLSLSEKDPHYRDDVRYLFPKLFTRETEIEPILLSEAIELQKLTHASPDHIMDACTSLEIPYFMIGMTEEIADVQRFWFSPECGTVILRFMFSKAFRIGMTLRFLGEDFVVIGRFPQYGAFAVTSTQYFLDFQNQQNDTVHAMTATVG